MSELKAYTYDDMLDGNADVDIEYYPKSEADKVIAELEESHKKEVGQLLIEIVELKDSIGKLLKAKTEQVMDEVFQKSLIYGEGFVPVEHAMRLVAELRHNKQKRCLAMALLALEKRETYRAEYEEWCLKWYKRWLAISEKFKQNSTAL